jgi:GT2 family glycosyltransferase
VSVVVPTHNRPQALKRLIASLDTTPRVEIIVVDDGSDPPVEVSDDRVRLLRNEKPLLLAGARNRGAAEAKAPIIVFMDDDCMPAPDAISLLAEQVQRDASVGIAGPVIAYLKARDTIWCAGSERRRWTGRTRFRAQGADVSTAQELPRRSDDFPSVFAMRKDLFEEIGGFDQASFPQHMTESDLADRVRAHRHEVVLVADAVVWHDIDPDASLLRRLSIPTSGAFFVSRDRVRFIRKQELPFVQRAAHLVFWFFVLAPAHVLAIWLQSEGHWMDRARVSASFLRGNWQGATDPSSTDAPDAR